MVQVDTPLPSPFASSLQFGYISAFMYEGDAPLAERRAQALSLDRSVLAELMGQAELRELIDPAALVELELELQLLTDQRKARDPDALHDALRVLGDLSVDEIKARVTEPEGAERWLDRPAGSSARAFHCASRESSAGPRPRMLLASGMPSARPCLKECRMRSSSR